VLPSKIFTVLPDSAVPVNVGVVTFVMLSVFELPESDAESRSGAVGADGAVVSMVMPSVLESDRKSVVEGMAVALIVCNPVLSVMTAMLYLSTFAVPLPTFVLPSKIFTVLPDSAVPVKVGVVTFVMLSVFELPESDAESRSGAVGAVGAVVSMVMPSVLE